jgi:hypothetical protein
MIHLKHRNVVIMVNALYQRFSTWGMRTPGGIQAVHKGYVDVVLGEQIWTKIITLTQIYDRNMQICEVNQINDNLSIQISLMSFSNPTYF